MNTKHPFSCQTFFLLLRDGYGLGPVKQLLFLGCLVINGEYNLSRFTNFEGVANYCFISCRNFPVLLGYHSVSIFSTRHKFCSIAHIPIHNSYFPNQSAFLHIQSFSQHTKYKHKDNGFNLWSATVIAAAILRILMSLQQNCNSI